MSKQSGSSKVQWICSGIVLLVAVLLLLLTFVGSTTYAFDLRTEVLAFSTGSNRSNLWVVDQGRLQDSNGTDTVFDGILDLSDSVLVQVTRVGTGVLSIYLRTQGTRSSVGLYRSEKDSASVAPREILITYPDMAARANSGRSTVFPFTGNLIEPDSPDRETQPSLPVLRSGEVTLLTESWPSRGIYRAATHSLALGDQVAVRSPRSSVVGLLVANEDPAMGVSYRVVARSVSVKRPVDGEYRLATTVLQRVGADPALQAAWWAVVFLWTVLRWSHSQFSTRKENH